MRTGLRAVIPTTVFAATVLTAGLSACGEPEDPETPVPAKTQKLGSADADRFVEQISSEMKKQAPIDNAAYWAAATYITDDTQLLASKATERSLGWLSEKLEAAKAYNDVEMSAQTGRSIKLLKLLTSMPAPSDAGKREELAKIAAKMEANYGAGKWCHEGATGNQECLSLQQIEKIIDDPEASPQARADAWAGWHETARPIRKDYQRFVELVNEGAREQGFADAGELWRSGYDMSPTEFEAETERLWSQVEPLYDQLHCYVRAELHEQYPDEVPADGLIPSHLLGNMWAQQWSNIYPEVQPYPGVGDLDVSSALQKRRNEAYKKRLGEFNGQPTPEDLAEIGHQADADSSVAMTKIAEDFYTSLGMPELPESFWKKSLLTQPRDRDVVCHASAWDVDMEGDVRIKMCIEPDEEQLYTIHHELGHIYYYLAYNDLPPLFQTGAHDGFHEAIGDTITLSLTPQHMKTIGLIDEVSEDEHAVINSQMKLALDKIVFLPWGKLVDQWRWKVFSGEIAPEDYNRGWWELRERYQGVAPPMARNEQDFDPGAKYHIPGNTPYTRYFLAFILQFQFQRALCEASDFDGPLYACDIYGNKEVGKKFEEMLSLGASQPWQDALEKLTGTREMDASAIIEYFEPLMNYLKEQNEGRECGWET